MVGIKGTSVTAAGILAFAFLSGGCGSAGAPDLPSNDGEPLEAAPTTSVRVDDDWFSRVSKQIENGDHRFRGQGGALVANNQRHGLRARFSGSGAGIVRSVATDEGDIEESSEVELDFSAWGRAGAIRQVPDAVPNLGICNDFERVDEDGACVERLEREHGGILEWWDNTANGLQQAWEIAERPNGTGEVQLVVDVRGATVESGDSDAVELTTPSGVTFSYGKLIVKDAEGRALPARLKAAGGQIAIAFDDAGARYPVLVDPFVWSDVWTYTGTHDQQFLGAALAGLGDVNGDGYDDVMVSAWGRGGNIGRVWAFYGSANGLPASHSWTKLGTETGRFGVSVASAGDVNCDGYSDAIVGEPYASDGGKAHVFLGSSTGLAGSASWIVSGPTGNGRFGFAVASAGDVDGDRCSDVLVGDPIASSPEPNEGIAYLYKGSSSGLGTSAAWSRQSNQAGAMFGLGLAGVGDINGDGRGDAVIGAPKYDGWGQIWVYVGQSGGTLGNVVMTDHGNQVGEDFGRAIAGAGDRKGDGYADFTVGAGSWDSASGVNVGRYYTYLNTSELIGGSWERTNGSSTNDLLGSSLGNLGDINGDGFADLAASKATTGSVDLGRGNATIASPLELPGSSVVAGAGDVNGDGLADLPFSRPMDPNNRGNASLRYGAMLRPSATATLDADIASADSFLFGSFMNAVGDVNGDGFGDLVIGDIDENRDVPKVHLRLGSATGLQATDAWTQAGTVGEAWFGHGVAGGDFNGDGYVDVAIGASLGKGRVSVYRGSSNGIANQSPLELQISAEGTALAAGDVNGDGYADLVVSAPFLTNGEYDEGGIFLFLGSASGLASTATLAFESNSAGAKYGQTMTMGDANCDGRADLVVGAQNYSNGELDEGTVYAYYGSSSGLTASTFRPEFNVANALFGSAVTLDADMNGDGCADLVVAAPNWSNGNEREGRVFYYPGSPSGLSSSSAYVEGEQDDVYLGGKLSGGDFDADGYGDVAVSLRTLPAGTEARGQVRVFSGSATGFPASDTWRSTNQAGYYFGRNLVFDGDFNGDGLSDLAADVILSQTLSNSAVRVFRLERGGATPRLERAGLSTPIPPGGKASSTSVDVSLNVRPAIGRSRVKLAVEMKPLGTPFDGTGLVKSSSWTDSGVNGTTLTLTVSGLAANKAYHYRVRALYEPTSGSGSTHSRWYYGGKPGNPAGTHFRTP